MIRIRKIAAAALLVMAAGSAFANPSVNGVASATPGVADLGVLNTTPGTFTTVSDSFGAIASFKDDYTFTIANTVSGGASVTGLDVVFNPTSGGFSFSSLASLTVDVFQGTVGSGTMVTGWSGVPSTTVAFNNLSLANNPYYIEISGTTQPGTLAASYTGVISAAAVPEPGSWALMAAGLLGIAAAARRRKAG